MTTVTQATSPAQYWAESERNLAAAKAAAQAATQAAHEDAENQMIAALATAMQISGQP